MTNTAEQVRAHIALMATRRGTDFPTDIALTMLEAYAERLELDAQIPTFGTVDEFSRHWARALATRIDDEAQHWVPRIVQAQIDGREEGRREVLALLAEYDCDDRQCFFCAKEWYGDDARDTKSRRDPSMHMDGCLWIRAHAARAIDGR